MPDTFVQKMKAAAKKVAGEMTGQDSEESKPMYPEASQKIVGVKEKVREKAAPVAQKYAPQPVADAMHGRVALERLPGLSQVQATLDAKRTANGRPDGTTVVDGGELTDSGPMAIKGSGAALAKAIQYAKSFQPKIDRAANFTMTWTAPGQLAKAVTGAKSDADRAREAKDQESRDLQMQLDAYRYAQQQAELKAMKDKLTSGN